MYRQARFLFRNRAPSHRAHWSRPRQQTFMVRDRAAVPQAFRPCHCTPVSSLQPSGAANMLCTRFLLARRCRIVSSFLGRRPVELARFGSREVRDSMQWFFDSPQLSFAGDRLGMPVAYLSRTKEDRTRPPPVACVGWGRRPLYSLLIRWR